MGNVLGVFFNEYLSSEFEAAPDLIPQLQTRIELADSTLLSNQGSEVFCFALIFIIFVCFTIC